MQPINEFMKSPAINVDGETTIEVAAKMMVERKIGSLLVKEAEEYVGIITKSDIVKKLVAEGRDPKSTSVTDVMSRPLLSKDQYVQRSEANEFMLRKHIKHLAVTQGKKILGILTITDMVA
jgi:signal-transduction protein with cAMP-binding, CBS, and nucleotidyltransferase domain